MAKRSLSAVYWARLKDAVRVLRNHVYGYEAQDGYSLRDVHKWDAKTRSRIMARAKPIKERLREPHDVLRPRTRAQRAALVAQTRQTTRNAKNFIVHKPTEHHIARLVGDRVSIVGSYRGGVATEARFFLFPKAGRTLEELEEMTIEMLPEMPDGFYVLLTGAHGDTGTPFERDTILDRLRTYVHDYHVDEYGNVKGFEEALVGYRFMSTTIKGMEVQKQMRNARRERQREYNEKYRGVVYGDRLPEDLRKLAGTRASKRAKSKRKARRK